LIEIRPPYSPTAAVKQVVGMFKSYGLNYCVGDRYSALWTVEGFGKLGFRYQHSDRDGSAIYSDALPLYTSGRARILDIKRHTSQLAQLERKTSSTGRDRISHPVGGHDDLATASSLAMVLAAAPAVEAPRPSFGMQTTTGGGWNGSYHVGGSGDSAGSIYASAPPEWWARERGVYHPHDRARLIREGVIKPPEGPKQ
jgi:hypothetical protein